MLKFKFGEHEFRAKDVAGAASYLNKRFGYDAARKVGVEANGQWERTSLPDIQPKCEPKKPPPPPGPKSKASLVQAAIDYCAKGPYPPPPSAKQ